MTSQPKWSPHGSFKGTVFEHRLCAFLFGLSVFILLMYLYSTLICFMFKTDMGISLFYLQCGLFKVILMQKWTENHCLEPLKYGYGYFLLFSVFFNHIKLNIFWGFGQNKTFKRHQFWTLRNVSLFSDNLYQPINQWWKKLLVITTLSHGFHIIIWYVGSIKILILDRF